MLWGCKGLEFWGMYLIKSFYLLIEKSYAKLVIILPQKATDIESSINVCKMLFLTTIIIDLCKTKNSLRLSFYEIMIIIIKIIDILKQPSIEFENGYFKTKPLAGFGRNIQGLSPHSFFNIRS